jgi:HlyD family secretion protein
MHSAPAEVTTESESPPSQSGRQPRQPPQISSGSNWPLRRWLGMAVVALILGIVLFAVTRSEAPATRDGVLPPGRVPVSGTLRLKGTTEAVLTSAILAPVLAGQQMSTLTITRMTRGGSQVKRGDLLVEFDRQAQMRDFIDKQAEYNKLADQVVGEQAKENAARAKDETELKQAEDNLRKAELEIQKTEVVSRIDAEKNQQNLDEAKATFEQLGETFDLKRKAALAAIRILEIQRERTRQMMLHAQANADLMQMHSPIDGVVVLNTIWKQGTMGEVQEGDQVEPGVSFMQVVDPSAMQVRVLANQVDLLSLQVGQTASVKLDAYPELVFRAKLEQQAPMGHSGGFSAKLRTFAVIFSIRGEDPRLMPDLSAAVDVDVARPGTGSGSR